MEELAWIAVVGAVALVPPIRRRLPPVAEAMLSATLSTTAAALRGLEGVIVAAMDGENPRLNEPAQPPVAEPVSGGPAGATGRRPRVDTSAL
jgi:hypothetical protein